MAEQIIARTVYDQEQFEQLVVELEALFISGHKVDHWGEQVLDQRQAEKLGLKGLRTMLGKEDLERANTLGLARIAQIIGLASLAARRYHFEADEKNLVEESVDWMGGI